MFGIILYSVLGSGEVQSWAKDSTLYERLPDDTKAGDEGDSSTAKSDNSINQSKLKYDI